MSIAIIGAMAQEIEILLSAMHNVQQENIGNSTLYQGILGEKHVALVQSGIGKVAAAMATTALLLKAQPSVVINTGSAGGIDPRLNVGDVVISTQTAHHDVDVTAFGYAAGQLPANPARFDSDEKLLALSERVLREQGQSAVRGLICSGDMFCNGEAQIARIKADFPDAIAVEMEAAAIAQVCHAFGTPFIVIRAISDVADKISHLSFDEFLPLAAKQSSHMVQALINAL
ncbi:5'-methylthioadenosine/S-adenosylhomocysteine nucleosidase [Pasteurellaceae bacterium HPA106]|uniref:5'-methylthioadenosine/S-adenosylhomocysteine nucleosidase n=1 Tax=Spirabiliibacterium pneumoniae TaxID=221400 RepID=UPI001AACAAC0|nr:5'-methylthioadenosine/S-adenosylhomocysteine nucleosidase [Spirabiliibacterium pneumoniae]MBE2896977.1 5'-methylthioadenosine/S-adenosylhomocysteine nucleosidase [Spirabiliibacterium pneumoniae]